MTGMRIVLVVVLLLAGCQQPAVPDTLLETRLQLGLAWLARGEMRAAERHLQRALAQAPEDYRSWLAMARWQQQSGDAAAAAASYRQARQRAPLNGYVLNNYGAFLCGLGQYDAAQRQFSRVAESSTGGLRADSIENSGYCYLNGGKPQQARYALAETVRLDPVRGIPMLAEAERRFGKGRRDESRLLLDVYQHVLPASAESVWLEIRFAAQENRPDDVRRYGARLARNFPLSIQYQHFLANEY